MALTLTFGANSQPRIPVGPEVVMAFQKSVMANYASGTSATGAVHFRNIKIPHGATILDAWVYHSSEGNTTAGYCHTVGIAGGITSAALFGSESFSTTTRMVSMAMSPSGAGLPYKVSVSDDAATRYVYPTVTTTTTGTDSLSLSIGLAVMWTLTRNDATGQ